MQNNPYVGPRPYERSDREKFFGRGREARDLLALMLAERVLLFYAQSGAGKTSLLNARVIPLLEDKGLDVLPVTRVGGDLPPGVDPDRVPNIFVFSALMGLANTDVTPETLLDQTLLSFLKTRCCTDKPPLLVLDQFEELFTTHRERWREAHDFCVQLRQALENIPNLGVTLAMREDHIAELDPYAPLLPGRLQARFRKVDPQAIIKANRLTNPDDLKPGQQLIIPGGAPAVSQVVHVVKEGEWVWKIARYYNVDPQTLIVLNKLLPPYDVKPGQQLIIPADAPAFPKGVEHVVASNETLYSIARHYGTTVEKIAAANDIKDPNQIKIGQKLTIPI